MDRAISRFTDESDLMLVEEPSDELMIWAQAFIKGNFSSNTNIAGTSDSVFDCNENQTNPLFCENLFDIWSMMCLSPIILIHNWSPPYPWLNLPRKSAGK
ncbi:hypothetical protein H072_9158 [Dactylellina haptotyla CBS 200.50]|uniref:Uncharacterized protein n=1 Tax=Dactylellina haptotyla (strain CBS 200.50) TaxID=1284197 RepID=S8A2F5_DACHA|nr:hypothetical protein H072_9158 [Dactylellina haptotyla CBS 200.50]